MKLIKKPHVIHLTIQSSLTVLAGVTYLAHVLSPELEALMFLVSGVSSVWAADFEKRVRHPHCHFKLREA